MEKLNVGWPCWGEEEKKAAIGCIERLQLSQGRFVKEFEKSWADTLGVKYAVATNSGTSANHLGYSALAHCHKWNDESEIIAPADAFPSAIAPFLQMRIPVVLGDLDPNTLNLSVASAKKLITKKTRALLQVPTLGDPAQTAELKKLAEDNGLVLIEDCCEAHGAHIDGKKVGSFGEVSIFSFYVAHNITTGEGGMVCTNNKEIYDHIGSLRTFGRYVGEDQTPYSFSDETLKNYDSRYVFTNVGHNYRMTDILAAAGIEQIKKLERLNERRRAVVRQFIESLAGTPEISFPFDVKRLDQHSFYTLPMLLDPRVDRARFCRSLEENGIETRPIMSGNLARQPGFRNRVVVREPLTRANQIMDHAFFVGCHPFVTSEQVQYAVSVMRKNLSC